MKKKILIILGHPAQKRESFCEELAKAYQHTSESAGYRVKYIKIADLNFDPILHEGYVGKQHKEDDVIQSQKDILWADHIVIIYPLWQFMIPALLKGFLERVLEKDFAYRFKGNIPLAEKMLKDKTVRIIQTSAMPALLYRFLTQQHAVKSLKSIFKFCGIAPVKVTFLGNAEKLTDQRKIKYLDTVKSLALSGE